MGNRIQTDICVFDSGIGGFSILENLLTNLPGARYAYCCDNQNFPYGTKPESKVMKAVDSAIDRALKVISFKILVIACNTASTIVLPQLRAKLNIPVVGVVPAIKPAAEQSKTKVIGLLATPATIKREYTNDLLREFASDCDVVKVGSSKLVELAERKWRGYEISVDEVCAEVIPFKEYSTKTPERHLDTVVLGCTHFPLLRNELSLCLDRSVKLIDSSEAISNRVKFLFSASDNFESFNIKIPLLLTSEDPDQRMLGRHSLEDSKYSVKIV